MTLVTAHLSLESIQLLNWKKVMYLLENKSHISKIKELISLWKIPLWNVLWFPLCKDLNKKEPFIIIDWKTSCNFEYIDSDIEKQTITEFISSLKKTDFVFLFTEWDLLSEIRKKILLEIIKENEINTSVKFIRWKEQSFSLNELIKEIWTSLFNLDKYETLNDTFIQAYTEYRYIEHKLSEKLYEFIKIKIWEDYLFNEFSTSSYLHSSLFLDILVLSQIDFWTWILFNETNINSIISWVKEKIWQDDNIIQIQLSITNLEKNWLIQINWIKVSLSEKWKNILYSLSLSPIKKIFMNMTLTFIKNIRNKILVWKSHSYENKIKEFFIELNI